MSARKARWEEAGQPKVSAFVSAYVETFDTLSNPAFTSAYVCRLRSTMARMSTLAGQTYSRAEAAAIFDDPDVKPRSVAMRHLFAQGEAALERLDSRNLDLASAATGALNDYTSLVPEELKLAPELMLREGRCPAMIAPGACPLSAIRMHCETGHQVIGIEPIMRNVPLAQAFIRKAGLARDVKIVHGQPELYDYSRHPIILMSTWAPRKAQLLATIDGQHINTIMMRVGHGLDSLLYPSVPRSIATWMEEGNFSITRRLDGVAHRTVAMSTWFFTRMQARKLKEKRRDDMYSLKLGLLGRHIRLTGPQAIPGPG